MVARAGPVRTLVEFCTAMKLVNLANLVVKVDVPAFLQQRHGNALRALDRRCEVQSFNPPNPHARASDIGRPPCTPARYIGRPPCTPARYTGIHEHLSSTRVPQDRQTRANRSAPRQAKLLAQNLSVLGDAARVIGGIRKVIVPCTEFGAKAALLRLVPGSQRIVGCEKQGDACESRGSTLYSARRAIRSSTGCGRVDSPDDLWWHSSRFCGNTFCGSGISPRPCARAAGSGPHGDAADSGRGSAHSAAHAQAPCTAARDAPHQHCTSTTPAPHQLLAQLGARVVAVLCARPRHALEDPAAVLELVPAPRDPLAVDLLHLRGRRARPRARGCVPFHDPSHSLSTQASFPLPRLGQGPSLPRTEVDPKKTLGMSPKYAQKGLHR